MFHSASFLENEPMREQHNRRLVSFVFPHFCGYTSRTCLPNNPVKFLKCYIKGYAKLSLGARLEGQICLHDSMDWIIHLDILKPIPLIYLRAMPLNVFLKISF